MLRANRNLPTYNAGWADVYREKEGRVTDFGAPRNVSSLSDMEHVARLAYRREHCREQDFEFAERSSFRLTMKMRTRRVGGVDAGCKAVVDGRLFDIAHVDRTETDLFLYMTEVGPADDAQ